MLYHLPLSGRFNVAGRPDSLEQLQYRNRAVVNGGCYSSRLHRFLHQHGKKGDQCKVVFAGLPPELAGNTV
jgi:hypothetical protein